MVEGLYVPHTTWPPGFPLLLAPITAFGLPIDWLYLKAYMIAIGIAGVALAWSYVRRLTESAATADVAALAMALLPFYWLFSRTAMTDGPTIACILLALILIDRAWARRRPHALQVTLVGLVCGLAMLLRGTNLCLIVVPLAYGIGSRKAIAGPVRRFVLFALHGVAFSVPSILWAARNSFIDPRGLGFDGVNEYWMLLSAEWWDSDTLFGISGFVQESIENFKWYAIYRLPEQIIPGLWNAEWRNWSWAPFLAIALTMAILLIALPRKKAFFPLAITIVPYGAFLSIYPRGGYERYWVPVTSLLMLLIVINWEPMLRRLRPIAYSFVVLGIIAAYIANLAVFAQQWERRPYVDDLGDMLTLFDRVGSLQLHGSAVHAYPHSYLLTLLTGTAAPMTVSERGIEPLYTHLIIHPGDLRDTVQQPPPAARLLMSEGYWQFYALPTPITERELISSARP